MKNPRKKDDYHVVYVGGEAHRQLEEIKFWGHYQSLIDACEAAIAATHKKIVPQDNCRKRKKEIL